MPTALMCQLMLARLAQHQRAGPSLSTHLTRDSFPTHPSSPAYNTMQRRTSSDFSSVVLHEQNHAEHDVSLTNRRASTQTVVPGMPEVKRNVCARHSDALHTAARAASTTAPSRPFLHEPASSWWRNSPLNITRRCEGEAPLPSTCFGTMTN